MENAQGYADFHAPGHIHEDAAAPQGAVEGGELAVLRWDAARHEVGFYQFGPVSRRLLQGGEDHTLGGHFLNQGRVYNLGVVLDQKAVIAPALVPQDSAQLAREVRRLLNWAIGRLGEGRQFVQSEAAEIGAAPVLILERGHRCALVNVPSLPPPFPEPVGLSPEGGKLLHHTLGESPDGLLGR